MFSFKAFSALVAASLLASGVRAQTCISACPATVQTVDTTTTPPSITDLWLLNAAGSSAGPPLSCAYTRLVPVSIFPVVTGTCVYDSTTGLLDPTTSDIADCPAAVPLSLCI